MDILVLIKKPFDVDVDDTYWNNINISDDNPKHPAREASRCAIKV